ncbi:MAG: glycine--tRNA ligase [Minisyncoccia bacterium]
MESKDKMEAIISLCKRRGFVFQGSEIYGGLAGTWDYGPLGSLLKNNIRDSWIKTFVHDAENMFLVDAAILMNQRVWQATGHVDSFIDPLVDDLVTNKRYRADHLLEEHGIDANVMTVEDMTAVIREREIKSPEGNALGPVRKFNMMLATKMGAMEDSSATSYLRPETAQGIFVNYKNVLDSMSPKLPFGIAQVGKAFRNEITPRDFIFRVRELEQMEIEYFIHPEQPWEEMFDMWLEKQKEWLASIGVPSAKLHAYEHPDTARAFYSKKTVDFEFEFPFGTKELTGLAHRTDYDLGKHTEWSGQKLTYFDEEKKVHVVPHVLEPTVGLDRAFLAVVSSAYKEDGDGENQRTILAFPKHIAPVLCAVSPLLKNKPELVSKAREIYTSLKKEFGRVMWDDNSNIGKRYRRQDEIGTPFCITVDFETLEGDTKDTVTVRMRDDGSQKRVGISDLVTFIKEA